MPRPLRIHVADGWYHAMSRGNGGDPIYRTDKDRRRFLSLLAELPERFGTELHAFVLMENHYHLLVRCRRADLSETLRWLQTTYAVRFNWEHRRRGHVFQGRFKSVLIEDDSRLSEVARYIHLNPVRIGGLGLSKEDQRRAKVLGCPDPGAELVTRRVSLLREYPWSSWRAYVGLEPVPDWLTLNEILGDTDGRRTKERQAALVSETEAPIRQGGLPDPWVGLVGGVVLGNAEEAKSLIQRTSKNPDQVRQTMARMARVSRPEWPAIVAAAESVLGRPWESMCQTHGDWGRDGVIAVAARHLGWSMVEVARQVPGTSSAALYQGVRRFWQLAGRRAEVSRFIERLRAICQK